MIPSSNNDSSNSRSVDPEQKSSQSLPHTQISLWIIVVLLTITILVACTNFLHFFAIEAQSIEAEDKRLAVILDSWKTLAALVAPIAIAFTIYWTARNVRVAEKNAEIARENAEIARKNSEITEKTASENHRISQANLEAVKDGKLAERYSKAVELLGKRHGDTIDSTSFIGGVYALERIAHESPKDHWTIMELLLTMARTELSSLRDRPKNERWAGPRIQVIFNVLGRRRAEYDTFSENANEFALRERVLYLDNLVIQGVSFRSLSFPKGWFVGTEFHNCDFRGAQLQDANFQRAKFFTCFFGDIAKTEITNCSGADFLGATFKDACYLNNTIFKNAILGGVWFGYPPSPTEPANPYDVHLEGADFSGAILSGAYFPPGSNLANVNFQGATMTNTTLYKVDVSLSLDLTEEQLAASWRSPLPRISL